MTRKHPGAWKALALGQHLSLVLSGTLVFTAVCQGHEPAKNTRRQPAVPIHQMEHGITAASQLPLAFEPNQGQSDREVKFLSRGGSYTVFLTSYGAVLALHQPESPSPAVLEMRLAGAAPATQLSGEEELPGKVNYLIGNNPARWRAGIPTYTQVRYRDAYPGIDAILHGEQGQLEYDFEVKPNADPRDIALDFRGADGLRIDSQGNLRVLVGDCTVLLHQLRIYQQARGQLRNVAGRYVIKTAKRVGFQIDAYDHQQRLIIDPVLTYSTYLGGSGYDSGAAIAVDSTGAVYVTGFTLSDNFPITAGAYHTTCGTSGSCNGGYSDVFVTKLSPGGSSLVYSTYLGGSKDDLGKAIAVDSSGSAYVAGQTFSSDFPIVSGALQGSYGGAGDAFVTKLSPSGSSLEYSTFLGGSATDEALGIAVDSAADAYITGRTFSANFPTQAPLQSANGGGNDSDAFVTELNSTGTALVYSTYLGGSGQDAGAAIAVDATGNAFVTGFTKSTNFPVASPLQGTCASCPGYADAFVSEIAANGASLAHSTYLGGNAEDEGTGIALDQSGNIYLTGFTYSTNFPVTSGAYQTSLASGSGAFVTKIAPDSSAVVYSTYLHGGGLDFGQGIATDSGNVFLTGQTYSTSFPTANSIQSSCKSSSCYYGTGFVSEMNASGSGLIFSTYLGGSYIDQAYGIGLDSSANAYVAGEAGSTDFPTAHAFQGTFGGSYGDAFVSNIGLTPAATVSPSSLTFASQSVGTTSSPQTVTLNSTGTAPVHLSSIAASGDFAETNTCGSGAAAGSTCTISVTFTPAATGTLTGTLTITDNASGSPQTVTLTGTGAGGAPAASLSPATLTFNSQNVGTTSSAQPLTLVNSGNAPLTINSITVTGTNAGDFAQTSNCGPSVNAGASCTINVTFTPSVTGTRTASISVTDNASGSPQSVGLTGAGAAGGGSPAASFSPTSLTFSSQTVGTTSAAQPVTLTNTGNAALTISSIALTGTNAGDFAQTNNCSSSLAASANCTINVTFTPTATGSRSASVTVTDNASNSPQNVALSGTGASGSNCTKFISPSGSDSNSGTMASPWLTLQTGFNGSVAGDVVCLRAGTYPSQSTTTYSQVMNNSGTASSPITIQNYPGEVAVVQGNTRLNGAYVIVKGTATTPPYGLVFTVGTSGLKIDAIDVETTHDVTVDHIEIRNFDSPAAYSQHNGCNNQVLGSYIHDNGTSTGSGNGISWASTSSGCTTGGLIASNVIEHNTSIGLQLYSGGSSTTPSNVVVEENTIVQQGAYGVTVWGNNNVVANNILYANGDGAGDNQGALYTGTANVVDHNVTFDPASSSRSSWYMPGGCCLTNNLASDPLFVSPSNKDWHLTSTSPAIGYSNSSYVQPVDKDGNPRGPGYDSGAYQFTGSGSGSPAATFSPANLTFSSQAVGATSAAQTVTLTNSGSAMLTITSIALTGTNSGEFAQTNNCGSSVNGGATCNINVTFTPSASGTRTASVSVTDNAGGSPQTVGLTGTGGSAASGASFTPTSLTFSSQTVGTTSAAQPVTLTNSGNAALTLTAIAITGTNASDFAQTNNCGSSLNAGASCTLNVTFTPSAPGTRTAAVSVTDNASGSPQSISLTGTGTSAGTPTASLSLSTLTFTSQPVGTTSPAQSVTLSNSGTAALSITSMGITGTNAGDFAQSNSCGSSLATNASCTINVTFTPTASGARAASISVTDNASGSPQTVSLTGTGLAPAATPSPSSLSFGKQTVGTVSPQKQVTLTNTGNATLTINSVAIAGSDPKDFAQTNNCSGSLAPSSSCTIQVTFAPTVKGNRSGSLTFSDSAPGSPQTVGLSGNGSGR